MPKTGRPRSIAAEHYPVLVKLAHAQPYSSQAELALVFFAETGITAHPDTFAKALKMAGLRVKQRAKGSFQSPEPNKAYGYNETHRRQLPEQLYPSCLTDTEWALVADLFESQGGRGVPPLHSAHVAGSLLLCRTHGVLMANATPRFSSLGQCLQNVPPVERSRQVRANA